MPFQQQVFPDMARAVPGDRATLAPVVFVPGRLLAEGPVRAGTFVWSGSAPGLAKNGGSGAPLGLVERSLRYAAAQDPAGGSLAAPDGSALLVARRGEYYVAAATEATAGQKVFARLADGAIATGTSGSAMDGAVETDWTVSEAGVAGDIITISNWS